jgi:transposase
LWTRKLVGDVIFQKFEVRLSLPTVGRIVTKLGMSPQRPLYRAYQQDPERVRVWKQQTYPKIRTAAAQAGAPIFFADEAGVRTDHHAGTTWAPIGRTPVVSATGARPSVTMVSAVSPGGQIHCDVFDGSMNAVRFVEFCTKLVHDCPTPVFLIVDGNSAHTAKIVKEYVTSTGGRLSLFFLPPYSPELNPDEWVWKNVKHDTVGRTVAMSTDHLSSVVYDALRRLQTTPQIIKGFFADPCLAYISGGP